MLNPSKISFSEKKEKEIIGNYSNLYYIILIWLDVNVNFSFLSKSNIYIYIYIRFIDY